MTLPIGPKMSEEEILLRLSELGGIPEGFVPEQPGPGALPFPTIGSPSSSLPQTLITPPGDSLGADSISVEELLKSLAEVPAASTKQLLPSPGQIAPSPAQALAQPVRQQQQPVQAQPIQAQPAQAGGMVDIIKALGGTEPEREFEQRETPDFVSRILTAPDSVQEMNTIQREEEEGGILRKLGGGIKALTEKLATDPILRDQLAQIAQALSAREPKSFPYQLATGIRESAQAQQQLMVRQAVLDQLAGRTPDEGFDLNMSVLPPDMQREAISSAFSDVADAAKISQISAATPTPQKLEQEFRLTEAQIVAAEALGQQRYLEMFQSLTDAGVADQLTSTQLGLMRHIASTATQAAVRLFGITSMGIGPDGRPTYIFKDAKKANKHIDALISLRTRAWIDADGLPEASMIMTQTPSDKKAPAPDLGTLDKTTTPPDNVFSGLSGEDEKLLRDATFMGSRSEDGKTAYYFDTTKDGRADTKVLK